MSLALNVLGTPLESCCFDPLTGYMRDGYCKTMSEDTGTHILCAEVDANFLEFTRLKGNDLSTPLPLYNFPGLNPGDKWCLCISRWLEALKEGVAPKLILEACHEKALDYTSLETLKF